MLKFSHLIIVLLGILGGFHCLAENPAAKKRFFIVCSYHRQYLWSQSTQQGLSAGMLKHGYLDSSAQAEELMRQDRVESSKAVIRKEWMNTKQEYSPEEIARSTVRIKQAIEAFRPEVVFLGDDNAANYIGNQLLDTKVAVVFWGINGLPLKYGLVEKMDRPGHNVTGVWQSGYLKESLELLHGLAPSTRTFAILACDSETSRPKIKELQALAREGRLPLQLVDVIATNSYSDFKKRALEVAAHVDAFFVLNHDTLKNEQRNPVDMMEVGRWYLENIHKPEASHEDQFVKEGMLCTANDSGFNQGFEAFEMAAEILDKGMTPKDMPPRTPKRGPLMVNRQRAEMLGISLDDKQNLYEQIIDKALALQPPQ